MSGGTKRKQFLGSNATDTIVATLKSMEHPEAAYTSVEMARIDPDPHNPRGLQFNPSDPRLITDDDPDREEKLEELGYLEDMALSIASQGVVTPITVYRIGARFRISTGERRFLASKLAGKETIPAIILKERPQRLRRQQAIENFQRRGLSLYRQILNVQADIDEAKDYGEIIETGDQLRTATGFGRTRAYEYMALLSAPEDVMAAIQARTITNVGVAAKIARIEDAEERAKAIKAATDNPTARVQQILKKPKVKSGAPTRVVRLGKTQRTDIVRRLMEGVAGKDRFKGIDWTDAADVGKAFKKLLDEMEKGTF